MNDTVAAPVGKKATQYTTVTMLDGRVVDFAGKRRLNKTSTITPEGALQVRLDFLNGESRLFTIPTGLLQHFALHGAEQKLGDEVSGIADIDDALEALDTLTERLNRGEWAVKREPGEAAGGSVLVQAIVKVSGKSTSEVRTWLATKTQAEKLGLRKSGRFAPVIAEIEAAKASRSKKTSSVDVASLEAELFGEGAE